MNDQNEQQAIDALRQVAMAGIQEQRSWRRWNIFLRLAGLILMALLILLVLGSSLTKNAHLTTAKEYTALVDLKGIILAGADAGADNVIPALQDAFKDKKVKGVVLRCNSPGGSPVQSSYIYDEIRRLRQKYKDKPLYAVASDLCASGGYYVISAADKIFVNKSSLVGSIGVRMQAFGVVEAMKKIGVESRELTAGKHKAILDPFKPRDPEEEAFLKELLANTHQHFINAVKTGRGDRLKDDPDIFSGLFWTGEKAKELGLVDEFGNAATVARDIIKAETLINFTPKKDLFQKLTDRVGASISNRLLESELKQGVFY